MRKKFLAKTLAIMLGAGIFTVAAPNFPGTIFSPTPVSAEEGVYDLIFNPADRAEKSLMYEGREIKFVAYENLVYVKNPANVARQSLSIYIPAEYLNGGTINGYTAKTAPIFLPNGVGGYMPGGILEPKEKDEMTGKPNAQLVALSRGYVVVSPAIRGRTTTENGVYVGKAPAFIVDYKAAVRYLRFNRNRLPAGDTEKIISNGTSAGGALSSALGSTGNAPEFEKYLQMIGAANERDDIFASSVYCPITNLENADTAYEWIFHNVTDYYPAMWQIEDLKARGVYKGAKGVKEPVAQVDADAANNPVSVTDPFAMTGEEIKLSGILSAAFPDYVNSLKLKDENGKILTLDKNGNGSFKDFIKSKYIESAQSAIDAGKNLSGEKWLTIENGKVIDADMEKYPAAVTRMKAAPAFDKPDLSSAENDEFGDARNNPKHFNTLVQKNAGGAIADTEIIKIMNPLNFIGRNDVKVAKYFRIRHGAADRDTALAIPAILALKLQEHGSQVNFFSPWGQGHGGDYDLKELFDWTDRICK